MEELDFRVMEQQVWVHPGGRRQMQACVQDGKRYGPCTTFYENGRVASTAFFYNDIKEGEQTDYDMNGMLIYEAFYHHGQVEGQSKGQSKSWDHIPWSMFVDLTVTWFEKGVVEIPRAPIPPSWCVTKEYKTHHSNGRVFTHYFRNNDKYNGKRQHWYEDGTRALDCFYVNGTLNGSYRCWYPNGQIMISRFYQNGNLKKYTDNEIYAVRKLQKKFREKYEKACFTACDPLLIPDLNHIVQTYLLNEPSRSQ